MLAELIRTISLSGEAQETFATHTSIYTQSLQLLFNKRCDQETNQEIYARAGTKWDNQNTPWEYEHIKVVFLRRRQQKEFIYPYFPRMCIGEGISSVL